ncbi:MAG: glycosyltransferase family 39 protein [Bacteroidia bacterium]
MNTSYLRLSFFKSWLFVIAILALVVRLWNLGSESITADEVSALLRLQYASFGEMLENGVRPDGHPAFVQILLWFWTHLFGDSEWVVRLPFALAGTGAVIFTGYIGKKWFGQTAGLLAAACLALLEFSIMYSQLARPYAFGLFFGLWAVLAWTNLLCAEKPSRKHVFVYALATALAMYTHYFSFLLVVLVGFSGLFLMRSHNWKMYLSAGVLAVLLWLPHLSFSLTQIQTGGVGGPGGWLAAPTPDFIAQHFYVTWNHSWKLVLIFLGIGILGFFMSGKAQFSKYHVLAFFWFVLPLAIGYAYSVWRNPVLQHSVLLFSFPFLLLLVFSSWKSLIRPHASALGLLLVLGGLFTHTMYLRNYKLTNHFGRLRELVVVKLNLEESHGKENVAAYFNVDAPYFLGYYEKQLGRKMSNVLGTINNGFSELIDIKKAVNTTSANYFIYGWSTRFSPGEAENIILEKFPYLVGRDIWFNSAVYVFSKQPPMATNGSNKQIFETQTNFTVPKAGWAATIPEMLVQQNTNRQLADSTQQDSTTILAETPTLKLDSSHNFSPMFSSKLGKLLFNPDQEIEVIGVARQLSAKNNATLVIQVKRGDSLMFWSGMESRYQVDTTNNAEKTWYFRTRLPENLRQSDEINVFVWCMKGDLWLESLRVRTWTGHTHIYGPRPDYAQ